MFAAAKVVSSARPLAGHAVTLARVEKYTPVGGERARGCVCKEKEIPSKTPRSRGYREPHGKHRPTAAIYRRDVEKKKKSGQEIPYRFNRSRKVEKVPIRSRSPNGNRADKITGAESIRRSRDRRGCNPIKIHRRGRASRRASRQWAS
ncbi:hypothetical protein PUN28_018604 [Cardiocondyla obscurior]|uniref:Uncharacterized protein n=1 Tax=Cardiocondyla obscurior TaxID=286306 RepID=A0AAW2EJ52_9HYME